MIVFHCSPVQIHFKQSSSTSNYQLPGLECKAGLQSGRIWIRFFLTVGSGSGFFLTVGSRCAIFLKVVSGSGFFLDGWIMIRFFLDGRIMIRFYLKVGSGSGFTRRSDPCQFHPDPPPSLDVFR